MRVEPFGPEHAELRAGVRRWLAAEVAPHAARWDGEASCPPAIIRRAAELGHVGLPLPPPAGGGADPWAAAVVHEELGGADLGLATAVGAVEVAAAALALWPAGTAADALPAVLRGARLATASVDARDVRAVREAAGWRLHGTAPAVPLARHADLLVIGARPAAGAADEAAAAGRGAVLAVVDAAAVEVRPAPPDRLGLRSAGAADVVLRGAALDAGSVLESPGALAALRAGARVLLALHAVGAAEDLLARGRRYAGERTAFGRPIGAFQVQRHRLADLTARLAAARRLAHVAVDAAARGEGRGAPAARAAVAGAATAWHVADEVLQLFGGLGYAEEAGIARRWRDARQLRCLPLAGSGAVAAVGRDLARRVAAGADGVRDPRPPVGAPAARRLDGLRPLWEDRHLDLRRRVRAFVDEEVRPHAATWERGEGTPRALFRRAGAAGLFAWKFDPRWGGLGPDLAAQAVVVEELARCGSGGVAADLGAHSDLAALYVDRAGTDAQRARWLAPSIAGELVGALAITEPDAGSDVAGTRTRAVPDGDGWVLDGAKTYITNGSWCDYAVVLATTDPEAGHAGKTLFVVEAGTPGFERRRLRMLGWRSSHTGELSLAGVRVGDDHRLGEVGSGFLHVVRAFAWERVSMSLGAVVAAERALTAAVAADAGAAPEVAALAVEVAAGRALAEHALRATIAEAADAAVQAAQAKLVTQRLAVRAADAALQRRPDDPEAARWLRDSRLGPIGGGTDEIMREIIGRSLT